MIDILIIENLLSELQCNELIKKIKNINEEHHSLIKNNEIKDLLWYYIKDNNQINALNINGIKETITIGKTTSVSKLNKHVDSKLNKLDKYKLSIYLNDVNSGTDFYFKKIHSKVGRGILFDITLPHESEEIPPGKTKYVIGCRI